MELNEAALVAGGAGELQGRQEELRAAPRLHFWKVEPGGLAARRVDDSGVQGGTVEVRARELPHRHRSSSFERRRYRCRGGLPLCSPARL
jgi:hypothetical protein